MRREDVADLFHRLPDNDLSKMHLVMQAGLNVCIDCVMRMEPHYAVVRGREAGNQDDGRLFFVPFEQIVYIRLERNVKAAEVEEWYRDLPAMSRRAGEVSVSLIDTPLPDAPLDPAEIARQNLLERIRAARSVVKK